jgi:ABC-type multidrug transport system ATPase subunit
MTIQNIHYQYPDSGFSLQIDSLNIEAGKAYLLLGLNGSGKTTFFSVLSGFLLNKQMLVPIGFKAYLCAYGWASKINLTVRDFFLQSLLVQGKPVSGLNDLLQMLDIESFNNQKLMSLSSGQLQRCLTELAFIQSSPLLLFDEPLNALDFLNRELFIAKAQQALTDGKSMIVSSHIDSILTLHFDTVLVLHGGRLIASASEESLRSQNLTYKDYYEKNIRDFC